MQAICQARCNSILTNRREADRHLDPEFAKATPAWMDKWGPRILARHLTSKAFKVADWYVDELVVRSAVHVLADIDNTLMYNIGSCSKTAGK